MSVRHRCRPLQSGTPCRWRHREGVVSEQVETDLVGVSWSATRPAGSDRYATTVAVSKGHFPTLDGVGPPALVATGGNWPDALAGGPAAYFGGPILLVHKNTIPSVTAAELTGLNPTWIAVLGGFVVPLDRSAVPIPQGWL